MKLAKIRDYRPAYGDYVCCHSGTPSLVMAIVFAGVAAAMLWFHFPPLGLIRWPVCVLLGVMTAICITVWRKSRGEQNWLLAYDGTTLSLKFRSYLNAHFPDNLPVIVQIERREIDWLRPASEKITTRANKGGTTTSTTQYLDIGLKDFDTEPLAAALEAERSDRAPGDQLRTRYNDHPVRLIEDGRVLRITWRSSSSNVKPSLKSVLQQLSSLAPIREASASASDYSQLKLPGDEADSQILSLLEIGETIMAIKRARELYNLSLVDAKAYVEKLQAKQ